MNNQTIIGIEEKATDTSKYQVLITWISWNNKTTGKYNSKHDKDAELPNQFTLDLPENIINRANKKGNSFNDTIEEFCYNFLTRKFGREVNHCQIWLPLD